MRTSPFVVRRVLGTAHTGGTAHYQTNGTWPVEGEGLDNSCLALGSFRYETSYFGDLFGLCMSCPGFKDPYSVEEQGDFAKWYVTYIP